MVSKEEAKIEIQKLVDKFKSLSEDEIKSYKDKEENTKTRFIEPLMLALGWDVHSGDVSKNDRILRGFADYAFMIGGVTQFFLEAKPLPEDLDNEKYIRQVIDYGYHKGITFVVLTNFQRLRVFNCEWNESSIWRNEVFDLSFDQFLSDFDRLWLLSKDSFKTDELGKYADKHYKRTPRKKIGEQLLESLTKWRGRLSNDLSKNYGTKYSEDDLDEIVQRLLDRLIFIRNCEDRGFEDKKLYVAMMDYMEHRKDINHQLHNIFEYYRNEYDSKLFEDDKGEVQEVDRVKFDNEILYKVLDGLYKTPDGNIKYNFDIIDADILGNLYEKYLGYILHKTPKRAKLAEKKVHRKEQGVYYTPTYIVEYIIENTLGELLKDKNVNPDKIKVLDPACGSGSFLIKAFDHLNSYYESKKRVCLVPCGGTGSFLGIVA